MRAYLKRLFQKLESYADCWWYEPLLAVFAAFDAFIMFIPNEAVLAAGVIAKPRRWLILGLWTALGSAAGALALAAIVGEWSHWILSSVVSKDLLHSRGWQDAVKLINEHGWWGLTLISLGPLPQHAAVIFVGLTRMPLSRVFFATLLGRGVKYVLVAWLAERSPAVLKKWKILPKEDEQPES